MSSHNVGRSSENGSCLGSLYATARTSGHRSRSPGCAFRLMGTQISHGHETGPTVDIVMVYGCKGASEKIRCEKISSTVIWPRDLISQKPLSRRGRIMTIGYDANIMRQNWDNSEAPGFERQKLRAPGVYPAPQETGDNKCRSNRPSQILHRRTGGKRDTIQGRDVGKQHQMMLDSWARQEINDKGNAVITTTDMCKDVIYIKQDDMLQDDYQASLEQVIDHDSPTRAACPRYRKLMGFPRYCRLQRFLETVISPAVVLGYPTAISAAALPMRCNHCSSGMSTLPSLNLYVYWKLTRSIGTDQRDGAISSTVVLKLPWSSGRQILQFLVICSVASVLVYLQRAGPYLGYSFLGCSGLLVIICVSVGTETMMRLLPFVVLTTLLISWVCQVFIKVTRAPTFRVIQNEPTTTPGYSLKTMVDKDLKFIVT